MMVLCPLLSFLTLRKNGAEKRLSPHPFSCLLSWPSCKDGTIHQRTNLWNPEGIIRYLTAKYHESLCIHPVTPYLQWPMLPSERLSVLEMKNSTLSLVMCWSNYLYLHQFPLTSSSSASSNWFWCATMRLDSLLTKDSAESFEHH